MTEFNEFRLILSIPLTIFTEGKLDRAGVDYLRKYLSEVLNEPESSTRPRKCFNGELFHHALRELASGIRRIFDDGGCDAYFSELPNDKNPPGYDLDRIQIDVEDATTG